MPRTIFHLLLNKNYMLLSVSIALLFLYLAQWESPRIDWQSKPADAQSWHEMVHQNERCKHMSLKSMGNESDVFYV